eukprot:g32178.t1
MCMSIEEVGKVGKASGFQRTEKRRREGQQSGRLTLTKVATWIHNCQNLNCRETPHEAKGEKKDSKPPLSNMAMCDRCGYLYFREVCFCGYSGENCVLSDKPQGNFSAWPAFSPLPKKE